MKIASLDSTFGDMALSLHNHNITLKMWKKAVEKEISFIEQISNTISPAPNYGQILLQFDEQRNTIGEACQIIKESQIEVKKTELFQDPHWRERAVLITVDSEDVQGVVLKLVEKGFSKIIGFKSLSVE